MPLYILPRYSTVHTMKFALALLAVLATIGLSQAYTLPDFNESYEDNESLMDILSAFGIMSGESRNELEHELRDFRELIPLDEFKNIFADYLSDDMKVFRAVTFIIMRPEFKQSLRDIEALKEHQAIVVYLEKAGFKAIERIQAFHGWIGMEEYVPPKIENEFDIETAAFKSGDGTKGMFNDFIKALPLEKIKSIYDEKMKNVKVFSEFVNKVTSADFQKLTTALQGQKAFQDFVKLSTENEMDWQAAEMVIRNIVPIPYPQIFK